MMMLITNRVLNLPLTLAQWTAEYQSRSLATNTLTGFRTAANSYFDFIISQKWNLLPLTEDGVTQYMVWMAQFDHKKASTIRTYISNLKGFFKFFEVKFPAVDDNWISTMRGVEKTDTSGTRKAAAIQGIHLKMLENHFTSIIPSNYTNKISLLGIEDIQIMTLFTTAHNATLRMSELLNMKWCDLTETNQGYELSILRSKAHKSGGAQSVSIVKHSGNHTSAFVWLKLYRDKCPRTCQDWIFPQLKNPSKRISDREMNKLVKKYAQYFDMNPSTVSSHSFRAGSATDLMAVGTSQISIMRQGRWKAVESLQRYERAPLNQWEISMSNSWSATGGMLQGDKHPKATHRSDQGV